MPEHDRSIKIEMLYTILFRFSKVYKIHRKFKKIHKLIKKRKFKKAAKLYFKTRKLYDNLNKEKKTKLHREIEILHDEVNLYLAVTYCFFSKKK